MTYQFLDDSSSWMTVILGVSNDGDEHEILHRSRHKGGFVVTPNDARQSHFVEYDYMTRIIND